MRSRIDWDECGEAVNAEIRLDVEAHNFTQTALSAVLEGVIRGRGFPCRPVKVKQEVTLQSGLNTLGLQGRLVRPRLWWPNGLGEHPLYDLALTLRDGEGSAIDRAETSFGVRELAMRRNSDDLWVQEVHGQSNRLWSIVGNP